MKACKRMGSDNGLEWKHQVKIYQDTFTQLHHPGNKNPTRPWLGWATLQCSPTTPVLHLLVLTIYLGILSNKKKYKKLIENDQLKLIYSTEVMYLCMFWNVTKISTCHEIEMFLLSHFVTEFSKCHRMSQNFRQTCFVTECRHVTGNPFSAHQD